MCAFSTRTGRPVGAGRARFGPANTRILPAKPLADWRADVRNRHIPKPATKEVDLLGHDRVRLVAPTGPTEAAATVRLRRGQQFFRQAVLTAYGVRCCISGINVPPLLVASHIKPWGKFPAERQNPRNGLCLSALHDAAFDAGLITLDEAFRVVLSGKLRRYFPQPALEQNFVPFEGRPIRLPEKLAEPDA